MRLTLNIKKSIEQNAAMYFEKAKKGKKRLEGVKATIARYENELAGLQAQKAKEEKAHIEAKEDVAALKSREKAWYHKFRWFVTSDGFIVAGGRDATTNEAIIKRHTEEGDLVLHTDMAGSPFFVIKADGREISSAAKQEVADAVCTFSRAFKLGMPRQEVFCVTPSQVTKQAKSGEFVPKGAFIINGSVEYLPNKINLALGLDDRGHIMAGPVEAISVHCKAFVELEQGDKRASDIAKQIKHKLGKADLDEIVRCLPAGEFKFKTEKKKR